MKHRHDRQDDASVRHVEHVGLNLGDRMDDVRAMLIEHALGIARRPAGITKAHRIALVEVDPFEAAVFGLDQILVGQIAVARRRIEQHKMLDGGKLIAQPFDDRQKGRVEEENAVLGVVDDIDKLFVEQPWIHRVQHPAHAGGPVPAHQMMAMVHRERRDAVALRHPQPRHGGGEAAGILADLAPARPRHAAVGPARDDFACAMFARCMIDQACNEQRLALHSHMRLSRVFRQG